MEDTLSECLKFMWKIGMTEPESVILQVNKFCFWVNEQHTSEAIHNKKYGYELGNHDSHLLFGRNEILWFRMGLDFITNQKGFALIPQPAARVNDWKLEKRAF